MGQHDEEARVVHVFEEVLDQARGRSARPSARPRRRTRRGCRPCERLEELARTPEELLPRVRRLERGRSPRQHAPRPRRRRERARELLPVRTRSSRARAIPAAWRIASARGQKVIPSPYGKAATSEKEHLGPERRDELVDEPRFADSRFSDDGNEPAAPVRRRVSGQRAGEGLELARLGRPWARRAGAAARRPRGRRRGGTRVRARTCP